MPILRLQSVTCLGQAETFTDELYVAFNGTKRSLPNMTQGQTDPLSDEFSFEGKRQLSLFENDGDHWYDREDFIVSGNNAGNTHYSLILSVPPDHRKGI